MGLSFSLWNADFSEYEEFRDEPRATFFGFEQIYSALVR